MLLGSHVGMGGKEMFLGSVKEALSYGADTFMVYTGAPQNTRRKPVEELRIEEGLALMKEHGMERFVVHAPYIINLGNAANPDTFQLAVDFLRVEIERTAAMHSDTLVLHPGSHVGEGVDAGIAQIVKGLNEVLSADQSVHIALETMAGKGSEIGRSFEELARIYDGVQHNNKLRICLDTCHLNDAGYPVKENFEEVLAQMERYFPRNQVACIHLNDSVNVQGASKDRHANLGFGEIGFDALSAIAHRPEFVKTPIILETPYVAREGSKVREFAPYRHELSMLREGAFDPTLLEQIRKEALGEA